MTNVFLANLAIADISVGIFCVLPNLSTFLQHDWVLGRVMCKIYYYIWNVSYIASIIILTVIAMERYIVIMHPLRAKHSLTNQRLAIVQCVMWSIALLYNIPYIILYDTISFGDSEFCYASSRSTFYLKCLSLVNVIVWYFLPLVLIGFLYYKVARVLSPHTSNDLCNRNSRSYCRQSSPKLEVDRKQSFRSSSDGPEETMELNLLGRIGDSKSKGTTYQKRQQALRRRSVFKSHRVTRERRKVIRLLIAVVVSFAVCVLPHNLKVIDHYWMIFSLSNDVMLIFSPVSFIILFMNSVLNPFLYAMFSTNFRKSFRDSIVCWR
ncbi:TRISR-like protein [Mya arenaria]|uniref:TRISR-like protein n=1 Tax=Mya arenaria TaxID=6604 RepID=A0ABY7FTA1_MYAAR|nr:trissin receptor-like [Mya arenaria]WAR24827.1 TRISR-like protein [Mya arenaria]